MNNKTAHENNFSIKQCFIIVRETKNSAMNKELNFSVRSHTLLNWKKMAILEM